MGQVLHGSATTTEAVRRAIQHSQESLGPWPSAMASTQRPSRSGDSAARSPTAQPGREEPRSTVLAAEDEAIIVAFRRHTLLPLDDCLYALQATIPYLTRSSLHRCLSAPRHRSTTRGRGQQADEKGLQSLSPSASSISTLPRCRPPKVSSTSSLPSTAPANSPSRNCTQKQRRAPQPTSCAPSSTPSHTRSLRC